MLQQTQVKQAMPYYLKFVERFPKVQDLAEANEDEILKMWQGLGYYSRARNLHYTAKDIAYNYNGEFPNSYKDLLKLKGVGEYTAAAIASFAYNEATPVVDGNVYRVLSRIFGIDTPINSTEGVKRFKQKANELIDHTQPSTYNQAIMEFGAIQCTPKSPNCLFCPFIETCVAYQQAKVEVK
jgi:A/G-specific adenine glycosylase